MTLDLRDGSLPAATVCQALSLAPHPEGGHYRETWRDDPAADKRGAATAILFLLAEGERSHWHRVDAAELWLWHGGAPLLLEVAAVARRSLTLGPDLGKGQTLQGIVTAHDWQQARSLGAWSLVSCVVAPAFEFAGFDLAPPGWSPAEP